MRHENRRSIITITTDFGNTDHYVGAMKGVILSINPGAIIVDITHEVEHYNIFQAAFVIRNIMDYFPENTVHLVVVDPGVGSNRRPIAVEAYGSIFVGPDNGIFSFVYSESEEYRVFEIENADYMHKSVSNTFHGRDIFAPAAAKLSMTNAIDEIGREVIDPVTCGLDKPIVSDRKIFGSILYVDSFGNLVTNISSDLVSGIPTIRIGERTIYGVSQSYSESKKGEILAIKGSSGFIEISVNQGRASDYFEIKNLKIEILILEKSKLPK